MKASNRAYEMIKRFEGYRFKSYLCAGGKCTIGYGHTKDVKPYRTITHDQALKYLSEDIEDVEKALSTLVKVKLNQNQYDSLVSFVFNVGTGAFSSSTLLKKLNNNDFESVPKELRKWIFAGGKACVGLKKRREAEAILFEADCNP